MSNVYKKLLRLSKSKLPTQATLKQKHQLLNQVKQIIDKKKQETKTNIHSGVDNARLWMEEFTGLDKVHAAQSDVTICQKDFIEAQNKRRDLGEELTKIQIKLNDLHSEIINTDKKDKKYVTLVTQQHNLYTEEEQLRNDFIRTEAEEREKFFLFTSKIKESEDKAKEQALRTKYWTVIISSAVTVIGVLGNGGISWYKMRSVLKTMGELGEETKILNVNVTSVLSELGADHIAALTGHVMQIVRAVQAGGKQREMAELIEVLKETNARLDQMKMSPETASTERLSGPELAAMLKLLKQVAGDVEMIKRKTTVGVTSVGLNTEAEVSRVLKASDQENSPQKVSTQISSKIKEESIGNISQSTTEPNVPESSTRSIGDKVWSFGSGTYSVASKIGSGTYNVVTGFASNPTVQSVGSTAYNSISNVVSNPKETISNIGTSTYNLAATIGSTTKDTVSGIVQGYNNENPSSGKINEGLDSTVKSVGEEVKSKPSVDAEALSKSLDSNKIPDGLRKPVDVSNDQSSTTVRLVYFGLLACIVLGVPFALERFP